MSNMLHVALVSAFPPGTQSLNEYGFHLAKGFAARADVEKVTIIADQIDPTLIELDLGPKIEIARVWRFNSMMNAPRILRHIREIRPDGCIWNLQAASFGDKELPAALGQCAPAMCKYMGVTSGVIAHNIISEVDLENTQLAGAHIRKAIVRLGGSVVTQIMMSASYCTVTLQGYYQSLRSKFPRGNVHLVPHGTFETATIEYADLTDRPNRIVTMGKFGTYKKLDTLIEAFEILQERENWGDLELVIGGTDHPNTPGYVDNMAKKYSGNSNINWHGYVDENDIPAFFLNAKVSVFDYSSTTGSSGVLHQTASYGAVPVFPYIGDFVDLCLDEGLDGAHYEPGDAQGMANAITSIFEDQSAGQKIADQNSQAAQGMPFSEVIDFHIRKIRELQTPRTIKNKQNPVARPIR